MRRARAKTRSRRRSRPATAPAGTATPAPSPQAEGSAALPRWAAAALGGTIALVVAARYAEPLLDGDLFWHLAYARQMLERGTLVPDHTLYSWTPADGAYIYCAWLAELALHALHRIGDLPLLFALRYAAVGAAALLLWWHARRAGVAGRLLVYLVILIAVLASPAGTLIKPELFSFLLFHALVFTYFAAKRAGGAGRLFFVVPVLVLVWANTHGGFVLAAPFLAATALGEALNLRLAPALALPKPAFRAMLAAWALSGLAVLATPYGLRYPAQLVSETLGGARADFAWNVAHLSIFDPRASGLHLVEFGALMLAILAILLWRAARAEPARPRIDAAILLANLAFVPLFALYLRTSYVWPIVFAYSAIHLLARCDARGGESSLARAARGALLALFVVVAARGVYEARYRPSIASWMGFGIGYINPVAEAEFLARSRLGPRLYNIFDSGGYLLWRLHPRYSVMADSRSFPYLAWFADQFAFATGERFAELLRKYPADTAIIDLAKPDAWRNFLAAADWRLAYYGPTAAVFVRADTDPARLAAGVAPDRLRHLRNGGTASRVFDFAVAADDHRSAWSVLAQIDARLEGHVEPAWLAAARALRDGHAAVARRDYRAAALSFRAALARGAPSARDRAIDAGLAARASAEASGSKATQSRAEAALADLARPPSGG